MTSANYRASGSPGTMCRFAGAGGDAVRVLQKCHRALAAR